MSSNSKKTPSRILDRSLGKGSNTSSVSLSALGYLFSEAVQYNQQRIRTTHDLEQRLHDMGEHVGYKYLELATIRDHKSRSRETTLLGVLQFISTSIWKSLFGKNADSVEKSTEKEDEYMISEKDLIVNKYISVPKDMGQLNCGAYIAGIVSGILSGTGFPARVTAHTVSMDPSNPTPNSALTRTVLLMKFEPFVIQREKRRA